MNFDTPSELDYLTFTIDPKSSPPKMARHVGLEKIIHSPEKLSSKGRFVSKNNLRTF